MCTYACICVHMCAYACICVHMCVHMCAYACICIKNEAQRPPRDILTRSGRRPPRFQKNSGVIFL